MVEPLENFESVGRRMVASVQSDTSWILTSDPALRFPAPASETNVYSGMAILDTGLSRFEVQSMDRYVLPKFSANVYVELDYLCSVPPFRGGDSIPSWPDSPNADGHIEPDQNMESRLH